MTFKICNKADTIIKLFCALTVLLDGVIKSKYGLKNRQKPLLKPNCQLLYVDFCDVSTLIAKASLNNQGKLKC